MRFIDLYSGIGGFRLAFEEIGAECVFSSEKDKYARQTYRMNFSGDIDSDLHIFPVRDIPRHDILSAGFPCQPFSMQGSREGFHDIKNGNCFYKIVEIIEKHQPSIVLLENVKGILSQDDGNTFNTILRMLSKLGYSVNYKIMNSYHFGLPQWRERVFIVACRHFRQPFRFPLPYTSVIPLGDVLEKVVPKKYTISDYNLKALKAREDKYKRFTQFLDPENLPLGSYTRTLQASYFKSQPEILVKQEGQNPRKLTPRECARLMGFTDSFRLHPNDRQAWKQLGNSVAIPVVKAIATSIKEIVYFQGEMKTRSVTPPLFLNKDIQEQSYTQLRLFH